MRFEHIKSLHRKTAPPSALPHSAHEAIRTAMIIIVHACARDHLSMQRRQT